MASIFQALRERFSAKSEEPVPQRSVRNVRLSNPWHAVSIVPGIACCGAARESFGVRHLSRDVPPKLPLRGCDIATCTCSYRKYPDRRKSGGTTRVAIDAAALTGRRFDDALNARFQR